MTLSRFVRVSPSRVTRFRVIPRQPKTVLPGKTVFFSPIRFPAAPPKPAAHSGFFLCPLPMSRRVTVSGATVAAMTVPSDDLLRVCQHLRVNNDNAQCVECGEQMIAVTHEAETIRSAPNAAGCNNPACAAALESGSYDETNPPAGCTNPHGTYIPDRSRERTITIGWEVTYECSRCCNNGTLITRERTEWDCGRSHRGDYISARGMASDGVDSGT